MIIFSLLTVLYSIMCCLIILLVLIQKGKGNMGLGSMGGGNQMLFGSSGGQDIFQKLTWILCAVLLIGSLSLSVLKGKYGSSHASVNYTRNIPASTNDEEALQD
ncbi:preprotein translocase subunit SecG [Candidatus Babeliales bacterium]|nr:preprotein translocase subunit SecG [Candidatus Babeliales bacterium]MBP9843375.1 preprotein translocase subunit SecG [Candidatus Babeliales bacterium]